MSTYPHDLREQARSTLELAAPTGAPSKAVLFLVCIVPILATIAFGAVDSWAIGFLAVIAAMIGTGWIVDALRSGEFKFSPSLLQLPLVGLLMIGCIQLMPFGSTVVSDGLLSVPAVNTLTLDPFATRFFVIRLVIFLIFFGAALVFVNSLKRLIGVAITLVVFGAGMAFFAIIQRLASADGIYGVRPTPQAIPFGSFVNQHHFAALMVMISGLSLGLLFGRGVHRDKKLLLAISAVVAGIAVLFTGSRGGLLAYLATVGSAAVFGLFHYGNSPETAGAANGRRSTTAAAAGVLLLAVAVAVFLLGEGGGLFRGLTHEDLPGGITSGRSHFWSVAVKIFLENPIIGAGLDAFGAAFTRYDTWNGVFRVEQAHNDYLQILADAGILGFLCVAVFIFLLFRNGLSKIKSGSGELQRSIAAGALAGCLGVLVHSFFDFPLRTNANAFVFLLFVVLATRLIPDDNVSGRGINGR